MVRSVIVLVVFLLVVATTLASTKSHKKTSQESSKGHKSAHLRRSSKELHDKIQIPGISAPAATTWVVQTSYGTDSECTEKAAMPADAGNWAYKSYPVSVCVPSNKDGSSGSFKFVQEGDQRLQHITYTDAACSAGASQEYILTGKCAGLGDGSPYYTMYKISEIAGSDYHAPMTLTYYASEANCNAGIGEGLGDGTGFAVYSYPNAQCFLNDPLTSNATITTSRSNEDHLEHCTGYTKPDCSSVQKAEMKDSDLHLPTCHAVYSCSTAYTNNDFGTYWLSIHTYTAQAEDDDAYVMKKKKAKK